MYRRVVLSSAKQMATTSFKVVYHVNGAYLLSQRQVSSKGFSSSFTPPGESSVSVFPGAASLKIAVWLSDFVSYEFILDVAENQPAKEAVEEITSTGVEIAVYNENGVLVCRNVPKTPASGSPEQTVVPGEMTSVPGEEPGEMTSEPIEAPGEMI